MVIIWVIFGNLIAAQQEKQIDAAKEQFKKQFPIKKQANNSALKLEELTSKLGVSLFYVYVSSGNTPTRYLHRSGYKQTELSDIKFQSELDKYINTQAEKTNDKIDVPPEKLQKFLNSHANLLAEIENHVLNSELPEWEIDDISNYTMLDSAPSFLNFAMFQKVLILNILEKTRQGKDQEAAKSLEVSWKLNQVLLKRPELISQLVVLIVTKPQTSIMRKMSNLSSVWQTRIERDIKYNLPQSLLNSFVTDSFILSNTAKNLPISSYLQEVFNNEKFFWGDLPKSEIKSMGIELFFFTNNAQKIPIRNYLKYLFVDENTSNTDRSLLNYIYLLVLNTIHKPYFRLSGIDYWDKINRTTRELPKEKVCSLNREELDKKYKIALAWWNLEDKTFIYQWRKVIKISLEMELTQKVIQVKEMAKKQGSWPKQVPGIETSTVCQDARWIYQVDKHGNMTIELKEHFPFLSPIKDDLTLNYSAKYPGKSTRKLLSDSGVKMHNKQHLKL